MTSTTRLFPSGPAYGAESRPLGAADRQSFEPCEHFADDRPEADMWERWTAGLMEGSGRIERTDGDVVPVRISERKLRGSSAGIYVWLLFQAAEEGARPWQSQVEVVDPEEQEEAVSRLGVVGACQRRMLVGAPLVETEQYRSIPVQDLPRSSRGQGPSPADQGAIGTICSSAARQPRR